MNKIIILLFALTTSASIQTSQWPAFFGLPTPCAYNNPAYPLHSAAAAGDLDKVQTLLASGANIHQKSGFLESTALHWAVRCENPELIRILLAAGADANTQEKNERVPLSLAPCLSKSSLEITSLLLPHTDLTRQCLVGDRSSMGLFILRLAILHKNTAMVRTFLTANIPLCKSAAEWLVERNPQLIPLALTCNSKNAEQLKPFISKEDFLRYRQRALCLLNNVSNVAELLADKKRGIKPGIQPVYKTQSPHIEDID